MARARPPMPPPQTAMVKGFWAAEFGEGAVESVMAERRVALCYLRLLETHRIGVIKCNEEQMRLPPLIEVDTERCG